ncbi:MAG: T9SS type A sorting domain-containing protein [Bacteroidetes bacterium]|nr:T9SS type A sorting domain-containing protein [Bacteroidota bacterium]
MKSTTRFLLLMYLLNGSIDPLLAQWSQTNGLSGRKVNEIITFGANLFAGTDGGVFRSTDNGANWIQVNTGLTDTTIVALAVLDTIIFAGDAASGVFRSNDNGTNWSEVNSGLTDTFISDLLVVGSTLFAGTGDGGKMFRSQNYGTTWAQITNGLSFYDGTVLVSSAGNIYLADDECVIFLSTNNGSNWTQISTGITGTFISKLIISGANFFAGSNRGVFLSTNNGSSWTQVSSGLTDTTINDLVASGTDLFAATNGGVFHSSNNGASWTDVSTGLTDLSVRSLLVSGTELLAGTEIGGIFRESLSALPVELVSFTVSSTLLNAELKWKTATEVNNYGFVVEKRTTPVSPLLQGGDVSGGWSKAGFVEGNGTINTPKNYSFFDKYLSTGKYSYRLKQIDRDGKFVYSQEVEVTISEPPKEFVLMQNYPNPFNPSTVISYQIPANSHVSLKVYDALGREAALLVNEVKEAGSYSATFEASKFSSGMYFYTLTAGSFTATKKQLLMK